MAKRNFGKNVIALALVLVMCLSMTGITAQAAQRDPEDSGRWSYAYYLGQEYLANAAGAPVKPDPVGYGFQGVITSITFLDDENVQWTFTWNAEANGEWRITGKNVSESKAKAWPATTDGKVYVGYCGSKAYTFTLENDGSSVDWTYARNGHANWFRYIRFIREYTVNVFYQNETGTVEYKGVTYTQQDPIIDYFTFYYPNGNIIDDSEYEDGEYTAPTTLYPQDYLPQSMIDLGYKIEHATDARGNDVTTTGVTISLLGENVLNVYCTLIPPVTEDYTVIHQYYADGSYEGRLDGGTLQVEKDSDFAQIVDGITKVTTFEGNTYTYLRYDVDMNAKTITLTYTRTRPTYDYTIIYNANFGETPETKADAENVTQVYDVTKTITVDRNPFDRPNYDFAGWALTPDGPVVYEPEDVLTFEKGGSQVLYAKWDEHHKHSYSLIYNGNGGYLENQDISYGDAENVQSVYDLSHEVQVDENTFLRPNHVFKGWNTEPDGSGVVYDATEALTLTAAHPTLTLYAQWEAVEYSYTVEYLVRIDEGEFFLFTGTLPEDANTGGALPFGTIVGEEIVMPPVALEDGDMTFAYITLDEIIIGEDGNVVRVYYQGYTPEEVDDDPPGGPVDPPDDPPGGPVDPPGDPVDDVPVTGDPMLFYTALAVVSGTGLLILRKKDEEEG